MTDADPGAIDDLNWMQQYAASEIVEHRDEGRISRREMMVRLVAVCGSAGAATAFLASCSSGTTTTSASTTASTASAGGSSTTAAAGASTTASTGSTAGSTTPPPPSGGAPPPTTGGAGHVLSVAANDPEVTAGDVTFPGPASEILGYSAKLAGNRKLPGIIVIHEIFGLTDHIKDVTRRLAKVGFIAVAPDLASRAGGTGKAGNVAGALTGGPITDRVADLNAAVDYLESQPAYNDRLGVVGFCFGGGMTLSFAAGQPKVLAAVPYYGPTPQPAAALSATKAAVLAHYGETDARVNGGIPDLEAAMAGKTFEKVIHPGAGHAFNNDTGGAYNEAEAVAAWTATVEWFRRYLV